MKAYTGFILFAAIFETVFLQMNKLQVLSQPTNVTRMISISDDHEFLVFGGDDFKTYIFKQNNQTQKYEYHSMLTVSSGDVDVAKITGDGDWLLVIDETGNSYIFNYNLTSDQFDLYQTIQTGDNSLNYAGTISEDHEMVLIGKFSGNIYVYQLNSTQQYQLKYIVANQANISYLQLSQDKSMMIVSTYNYDTYVYEKNGNLFTLKQTIDQSGSFFRRIFLTNDKQYLAITGESAKEVFIYVYNGSHFHEQQKIQTQNARYTSISQDHKWIILSQLNKTTIYYYHESQLSVFYQINTFVCTYHLLTDDLYYLFQAHSTFLDVYKFYEYFASTCEDQTLILCQDHQMCSQSDAFKQNKFQICQRCNIFQCLEYRICPTCTATNQYFQNSKCQNYQNSLICLQCDESNNYFQNSEGSCEKCSPKNCLTCSSLTQCKSCQEHYILKGGECQLCDILYCQECQSESVCLVCVEGFYLQNGECMKELDGVTYALIAVVVVLVVIVVILVIVFCRRETADTETEMEQEKTIQLQKRETKRDSSYKIKNIYAQESREKMIGSGEDLMKLKRIKSTQEIIKSKKINSNEKIKANTSIKKKRNQESSQEKKEKRPRQQSKQKKRNSEKKLQQIPQF